MQGPLEEPQNCKVLRKLANAGPPSRRFSSLSDKNRLKSATKERLKKLDVDARVRAAMDWPNATDHLKEHGQKFLDLYTT